MQDTLVRTDDLVIAHEILKWIGEFIAQPNEAMKRPGHSNSIICPFAQPSIDAHSLYFSFHHEIREPDEDVIKAMIRGYISTFGDHDDGRSKALKTVLVVMPELPEGETSVLDAVQKHVKDEFVSHGLMLAQFHSLCREPSVHNEELLVAASPRPFIAIRHMALHDILFLREKREWFREFAIRFGHHFGRPEDLPHDERYLVPTYHEARQVWGD